MAGKKTPQSSAELPYPGAHLIPEAVRRDIHIAARELRDFASRKADLRVFLCGDLASDRFVQDEHAHRLNVVFFEWADDEARWWDGNNTSFFSPVIMGARYECEPFWCNKNGFFTRAPNAALSLIDMSEIERFTGCKATIVVPVHLPFGRIAAATFHPNNRSCEDLSEIFEKHADHLEFLSRRLAIKHMRAIDAIPKARAYSQLKPNEFLRPKEIECLQWAAAGKTDSEIGDITARSHATIRYHIENAMEKLDAVNRSQAIFKAAQLGYIAKVH